MTKTLAEQNYGYALRLYARYVRMLPSHIDRDAIRSAALEGLVKAASSYDGGTKVPFKNWAARRIIGQMRDEMRVQDHLSRRMRERMQRGQDSTLLADPDYPISLEERVASQRGDMGAYEIVTYNDVVSDVSAEHDGPWEERARLSEREVHHLLGALPESEFRVMFMRYYEGMLVVDVARALGLSESRVNQLETSALRTMRGALPAAA